MTPKREYFNGLAEHWDGFPCPPDTPQKVKRFVHQAVPAAAQRILDIGCGTGILLDPLRSSNAVIVELDSAERMLIQNRQKSGACQNISHICAEAGGLPFPSASFDAILCFNALPHLEPITEVLARMLECLRPAGVLSVGHLMGSETLNAFHAAMDGPVNHDHLPNARELAELFSGMNADVVCEEEAEDWYFVQVRKRS